MRGLKEIRIRGFSKFLSQIINDKKVISVAQLSMVDAARQVEKQTSKTMINPLNTLVSSIVNQLEVEEKNK